jgi:cyanophycinase
MYKLVKNRLTIFAVLIFTTFCLSAQEGSLVIAGGALSSSNSEIFNEFISLAGGKKKARIGIIAAASEKPITYGGSTRETFIRHGVHPKNVYIIPIAVIDDKSTPEDESLWKENVNNSDVINLIEKCNAIWFTGGDQMRITQALFDVERNPSLALAAIQNIYQNGGVIGGTSAGAAIMSEIMIAAGSSLEGLRYGFTDEYNDISQQEEGPIHLSKGLGFLKNVIIDQHFDRKARIGRLIMSTFRNKNSGVIGYGIDENTAVIVSNEGKKARVIGSGGVTIVDVSNTSGGRVDDGRHWFKNVIISFAEANDYVDLISGEITPNPIKKPTTGNEYFRVANNFSATTLSPNSLLKQQLTYLLVDNSALNEVKSYSYLPDGKGFEITLRKTSISKGYWAYIGDEVDRYTVIGVEMDIVPVDITINRLDP